MSLYKYVNFESLKSILRGTIRFTQPGAFNDPFEMVPDIYVPEEFGTKRINIRFSMTSPRREQVEGALDDAFISEYCNDNNSRVILDSLNGSVGVLCLSKNDSSLLMWAHYADSYSGCIVQFDETHDFFSGHFEVKYSGTRPKVAIASYLDVNSPVPIAELCVKGKEWEYEHEVRIARSLTDCRCVGNANGFPVYVMDVPQGCIESVMLGERMPIAHQREIWDLVKDIDNVSLYVNAISNQGYEFRREPIKLKGMSPILSPRTAHIFVEQEGTYGEIAQWLIEKHPLSEIVNKTL